MAESVSFSCTVPAPEYECRSGSEIRTRIRFRLLTRDSGPVPAPKYKCGSGSGSGSEIRTRIRARNSFRSCFSPGQHSICGVVNLLRSLCSRHCDFYKAVTEQRPLKGVASETIIDPATVITESRSAPQLDRIL